MTKLLLFVLLASLICLTQQFIYMGKHPLGDVDWQNKARYDRYRAFNIRQKVIQEMKRQQQELSKHSAK
jgi:hypothetical protein